MTRRLQVLFLVALLGVLAAAGVVVGHLTGPVGAAVYAVAVVALLLVGAARARAARVVRPADRSCDCCASTVHDPLQVR